MNPKWIKAHLTSILAVAGFVAVLALAVWQQQRISSKANELKSQIEERNDQLRALLSSRPFPSAENFQLLQQSRQALDLQYSNLHAAVCVSSLNVAPATKPIEFFQLLAQRIGVMRLKARQANVKLPEGGFAFGFSRYASKPPDTEDPVVLAKLTKQLAVVERLVETLTASGVDEIRAIRRSEVDAGGSASDILTYAVSNDPKSLYQILPFELEFSGTTQALREFLNRLATLDCFFAVRTLTVNQAEGTGVSPDASEDSRRPSTKDTGTAERPRVVATVRVELVEFAPEGQTAANK